MDLSFFLSLLLFGVVHPPHTTLENEDRGSGLFPPVTDSVSPTFSILVVDFSQRFAFFQLELLAVSSEWIAAVKGKLNMVLGMSGHSQWELEITTAVAENEKGQKKWERNVPLPRVVVDLGHLLELLCRGTMSASDLDPGGFVYHRGKDDWVDLFGVVTVSGR